MDMVEMPRGRPRKSQQQHHLEGTYRPRNHDLVAEPDASGDPIRPEGLDENGVWLWDLVVTKWMGEIDSAQLEQLCETWSLLKIAIADCKADPRDKNARLTFSAHSQAFNALAGKFGLNPRDRAGLVVAPEHAVKEPDGKDKSRFFKTVG
jgi:hypothetical protein